MNKKPRKSTAHGRWAQAEISNDARLLLVHEIINYVSSKEIRMREIYLFPTNRRIAAKIYRCLRQDVR